MIPRHLIEGHGGGHAGHEGDRSIKHGCVIGGVGRRGLVELIVWVVCQGGRSFVMKVGNHHRSNIIVNHTITACFYLFHRRRIQIHGWLCRSRLGCWLCARPSLDFADQRYSSIFGVYSSVVSEQKVSSDKGTAALCAFERSLFGVWARGWNLAKVGKRWASQPHHWSDPSFD